MVASNASWVSESDNLKQTVMSVMAVALGAFFAIGFNEIENVSRGEPGDIEGGSISYHVLLKLRTGKEIALFVGFFAGSYDKSVMAARRQRLVHCLQSQ